MNKKEKTFSSTYTVKMIKQNTYLTKLENIKAKKKIKHKPSTEEHNLTLLESIQNGTFPDGT